MGSSVVSRASGLHGPATDTGAKLDEAAQAIERLEGEVARWIDAYKIAHDQATENGSALSVTRSKLDEAVGALEAALQMMGHAAARLERLGQTESVKALEAERLDLTSTLQKIRGQA